MALKDVKEYVFKQGAIATQAKVTLEAFENELKNGNITEEQLIPAKEYYARIDENYQRLLYVMYLWEIPNRNKKRDRYKGKNQKIETYFKDKCATNEYVLDESKSCLDNLKAELKKLVNK